MDVIYMPSSSIGSLLFSFGSTERTAQEGGRIGGHSTPSLSLSLSCCTNGCVYVYTIYIFSRVPILAAIVLMEPAFILPFFLFYLSRVCAVLCRPFAQMWEVM
jgi:hypothetical protein